MSIDGYNPYTRTIKHEVYPGIGRHLTQDDVNKRVVRVYPLGRDCTLIPINKNDVQGSVLKVLKGDQVILNSVHIENLTLGAQWLDKNWLTVAEFIERTEFVAAQIFETYDSDPPY